MWVKTGDGHLVNLAVCGLIKVRSTPSINGPEEWSVLAWKASGNHGSPEVLHTFGNVKAAEGYRDLLFDQLKGVAEA